MSKLKIMVENFGKLDSDSKKYVIAICQALAFAQNKKGRG